MASNINDIIYFSDKKCTTNETQFYESAEEDINVKCPPFWQNKTKRISIKPLDFTSTDMDYMEIQTSAYIGMGLNIAMVILFLVTFKGKFKKLYKAHYTSVSWKRIKLPEFFMRWFYVLFPFFEALSPLSDSILGK